MGVQLNEEELTMLLSDASDVDTLFSQEPNDDEFDALLSRFEVLNLELHNLLIYKATKGDKAIFLQQLNRLTMLKSEFINALNQ